MFYEDYDVGMVIRDVDTDITYTIIAKELPLNEERGYIYTLLDETGIRHMMSGIQLERRRYMSRYVPIKQKTPGPDSYS